MIGAIVVYHVYNTATNPLIPISKTMCTEDKETLYEIDSEIEIEREKLEKAMQKKYGVAGKTITAVVHQVAISHQ